MAAGPTDSRERYAEDTPEHRAALEKDPVMGVHKSFKPRNPPRSELDGPGSSGSGWRLRDLLPDLARTYGVQFIADAYGDGPAVQPEQLFDLKTPALWELLNGWAGLEYRWDHEGDLVRLRDWSWYLDRPREIPLRLLRRWRE